MSGFEYYLPVNIVFGKGQVSRAGELTASFGKKALIVTGRSSAKRSGLYDRVHVSLTEAGVESELFDKVTSNPLTTTAAQGAALAKIKGCDVIVGIGGGSIMDCAKGIAFLSVNSGDVNDYIFGKKASDKALPLILIPTTCGTGSEGNSFAVLTNPETGDKKSLRCSAIVAKASIVDPDCMKTMPGNVLASVGFDALCHCMEAYTAKRAQPFTDALAGYAIPRIYEALPALVQLVMEKGKIVSKRPEFDGANKAGSVSSECDGANKAGSVDAVYEDELWETMSLCSLIGGMVINTAGVTLAHAMEHPVSGLKNVVHGQGLAALTPVALDSSCSGNPDKFVKLSHMLGGSASADCASQIRKLLHRIHLEYNLSDLGVKESDIPWLASNCLKVSPANIQNNPVLYEESQIAELYRQAL